MDKALLRTMLTLVSASTMLVTTVSSIVAADKKYDPGVTDSEIKIGNIAPYSGPASAYGVFGSVEEAYFRKVNDEGGVRGRKIKFISYDDAYSPPKAVEQVRKLVESDEVLLILSAMGTASNSAIHKYLNAKKIPQLFIATGATKFADPKNFPWTMGWVPSYEIEGGIYAKYVLENHPSGKIGVLFQNDDFGKDLLKGIKDGLGEKVSMIVAEESYETSEPTIDSHIVKLKAAGAGIMINISTPKFGAQAIKKAAELNWKPVHIVGSPAASVGSVLKPAGLENSQGVLSAGYLKDPTDPSWQNDPAVGEWSEFMDKYYPQGDKTSNLTVQPYLMAKTFVKVLEQAGDDLTRGNIMRQAANLKGLKLGLLIDGIEINTSAEDFHPLEQMQMMKFSGESWRPFGPVLSAGR